LEGEYSACRSAPKQSGTILEEALEDQMKKEHLLWTGVGLVAIAILVSRQRNCNRGCQNLFEHLAEHGAQDIVAAFLA